LPSTYKAEARFRVKTENHFEATNNEQFQPNPSEMFATRSRGNRKICSLPSTYKAEARFRVKTENHFEATNNEQFQPNPSEMFATRS
jgi:hypothetical protein